MRAGVHLVSFQVQRGNEGWCAPRWILMKWCGAIRFTGLPPPPPPPGANFSFNGCQNIVSKAMGYCDTSLSYEERTDSLISNLTPVPTSNF